MAEYSKAEIALFGKYYGDKDLINNKGFWLDTMLTLMAEEKTVVLPLLYNPESVRRVHAMLKCPPGKCGLCCHYQRIPVTDIDTRLIVDSGLVSAEELAKHLKQDDKGVFLSGDKGGCPFLKNNACSIYNCRPNVCWQFPVMGGNETIWNGQKATLLTVRLKCKAIVDVARIIIGEAVAKGNCYLLPDLTIVQMIKQENTDEKH